MANWAKKTPAGSSTRRKWNLEDRTSLNNLKYHFAADGCSDVQYDLARQLLETNSESDENASHVQGVHWLLCAAQQGHEDALSMLNDCYRKKRGITEANEMEVQAFLSMTPGERAARKAARELFACLSNGGEHITPRQLERRMREIYNLQKRRRRRDGSTSSDEEKEVKENGHVYLSPHKARCRSDCSSQDMITEANLVSAAVNYSHGQLPPVNDVLSLSVPHPSSLDHVPLFHRLIFHPIIFFTLLYHRFINIISAFPGDILSNIKFVVLLLVYFLVSHNHIEIFMPMVIYYLSIAVMIWSTFKMLKAKHNFIDFRIWSGLFLSYGDNVDADHSENLFLRNNMKPYLCFFCAFVVNLLIYPLIENEWKPHSEITVISFSLVFITMIAFMYTAARQFPDALVLFSFGVNVLAKYPYEMDNVVLTGWRFLDLKVPTFSSFVIGNGIEFCLNCRAVLYLLIPGFFFHLAYRSNWHGTYKYLIPHCVTLSWLQICFTSSQSATMFGLIRAALGLSGVLLFLPLFGIVTLMIPIFVVVEWLGLADPKIRISSSFIGAIIALFGSCLMAANRTTQKYVTFLQVVTCIIAAAVLTLPYMTSNFKASHNEPSLYRNILPDKVMLPPNAEDDLAANTLSYDSFYNYCSQPAWDHLNKIQTQLRCSHLDGTIIKWKGVVSNIEIVKVYNIRETFIRNYLPQWLADAVTCFYGEKNQSECFDGEDCEEVKQLFREQKKCNLNKWNSYEYEIKIRIYSGLLSRPTEIQLIANDYFGNFSQQLNHSDNIWFRGTLINTKTTVSNSEINMRLGVGQPIVRLSAIGCITCHNKELTSVQIVDNGSKLVRARLRDLMLGVKYLLNVLFNPLLRFK